MLRLASVDLQLRLLDCLGLPAWTRLLCAATVFASDGLHQVLLRALSAPPPLEPNEEGESEACESEAEASADEAPPAISPSTAWRCSALIRQRASEWCSPLEDLATLRLAYPGICELTTAEVIVPAWENGLLWSGCFCFACLREACGLPRNSEAYDLEDFLAEDLALSGDFLEAWQQMNHGVSSAATVSRVIQLLRVGTWDYEFYPTAPDEGVPAVLILRFGLGGICGLRGFMVIVEPEADPVGFGL